MRFIGLAFLFAVVLAAPAAAAPEIVVGESVRGVELGDSRGQVVDRLGEPLGSDDGRSRFGRTTVLGYEKLTVTLVEGDVVAMRTTRRRDRTADRVGVGSRRRAVRRRVRRVRCARRHCRVGRRVSGGTITQFDLRRGRVDSVLVARALE